MQCPSRSLKYSPGRGALFLANLNESVSTNTRRLEGDVSKLFFKSEKKGHFTRSFSGLACRRFGMMAKYDR